MKSKFYTRLTVIFATILMFNFALVAQTSISVAVNKSENDAEEVKRVDDGTSTLGEMDLTSSDLELCSEDNAQWVGMVFENVQIPIGATINSAYVQFTPDTKDAPDLSLTVYGFASANPPSFTETLFDISSRARTAASVAWAPPAWTPEDQDLLGLEKARTPDISSIIQEIIGNAGWAPGNNLGITITGDDPAGTHRCPESWDGATRDHSSAGIPELNVVYSTGTAVDPIQTESLNVYPNPTEGMLTIAHPSRDQFGYEIYTISGKLVANRDHISGQTANVDLTGFEKGMYFVVVRTAERTETHKLILK